MSPSVTPPLCERCWAPIQPGEAFARLGTIRSANLRGDAVWDYTYLHPYSAEQGCDTGAAEQGRAAA